MTRLCDLSVEGDSVTSVGWSERVSEEVEPPGPWVFSQATQLRASSPPPSSRLLATMLVRLRCSCSGLQCWGGWCVCPSTGLDR